jgi:hypothetical protein
MSDGNSIGIADAFSPRSAATFESHRTKVGANSQDYIRFVSAQGFRIREGKDCFWIEKRKGLWESAPSHRRVHLSAGEAAILFHHGAIAIRFTCEPDEGAPTYQYIWDDKQFSLDSLHKDARRNVRKNI